MPERKAETITIEKLVFGGYGLGRLADGMVVLVRFVLPGETVVVIPRSRGKGHAEADLAEILTPSPRRIVPCCRHYGICGGCDLQHTDYPSQLEIKKSCLAESLARSPGTGPDLVGMIAAPIASPDTFHYRSRLHLHCDTRGRIGYYRFRSRELEPINSCPLARPVINQLLNQLESSPSLGLADSIELHENPTSGKVTAILHTNQKPRPAALALIKDSTAQLNGLETMLLQAAGHGIYGPQGRVDANGLLPNLAMSLPASIMNNTEAQLSWEAGVFTQVNQAQNRHLVRTVLEWADDAAGGRFLDLYCGMGNFSIPLAMIAGELLGLEGQGAAIRSARKNAESAGLTNCRFEKTPVATGVRELANAAAEYGCILLDPPRAGAADLFPQITALNSPLIIYISCNPATLARDLALFHQEGYRVERIQPLDMFPQTHHLETAVLLRKQ